jgi:hypothetical protein
MTNSTDDDLKYLHLMESELTHYLKTKLETNASQVRKSFTAEVVKLCGLDSAPSQISTLLQQATESTKGRRDAAILTARLIAVDGILLSENDLHLPRMVVALIEAGFPDGCRQLRLSEKRQTYEKIDAIRGLHDSICQGLRVLANLPCTIAEIETLIADILRAVRKDIHAAYLQPFDGDSARTKIVHICDQIATLHACKDSNYKALFGQLQESTSELNLLTRQPTFFNLEFVNPFLKSLNAALQDLSSGSVEQFACSIESRRKQPQIAEKRYPLHRVNEMLTVTVPMMNSGPGMATDVIIELDCGSDSRLVLDVEQIRLGDIPPGEFAFSFRAMVIEPTVRARLAIQVSWNQLFAESKSVALDLELLAQDSSVDWSKLEQLDPFSLEEADSAQFVGRTAKVQAIGNRLLKAQMSSTYITGQKRVGKTSLAKAVLRYVCEQTRLPVEYETMYLEWGEYSTADARGTVMALGQHLYDFLKIHLPKEESLSAPNFDGSLAPLNIIAKALEQKSANKRFVFVLDEFDEIHPEMYRFGPLAEVFFANLRTLAARKNLAFILVGGEKMPFIIGAQGDQLNKFVREPLDYFSRADEWNDFVELVTGPLKGGLNWEESALNELFTLTNGHPYYTKLLCAKVFSNAVVQRDTEIISRDIRHALSGRVSELDTNAFAHFWKDGINSERETSEVIELKRLRLLVAFGRASRFGKTTKETVATQLGSSSMQPQEVSPLIDDFCRRDIMNETAGDVVIQLPIFFRWLKDVGISKLITSTLAEDLEAEQRKANDIAYVTAKEIETLISSWPLYRGKQITGESVRAWLSQVEQPSEQRLLFTILVNLKFVSVPQIGEQLRNAHERLVAKITPPRTRENKIEKRRDLLITYLDGPGKSGSTYARSYAKENDILLEGVVEPSKVQRRLSSEIDTPNAVVIVDDLAGTGSTVALGIDDLLADLGPMMAARDIPLVVILMYSTEEAQSKVQARLQAHPAVKSHLHICNLICDTNRAFPVHGIGFWSDEKTRDRAKALCIRLGSGLYKDPLGFGSQSLLVAFPDTCPNNNLPIIFASKSGQKSWRALIERPTS